MDEVEGDDEDESGGGGTVGGCGSGGGGGSVVAKETHTFWLHFSERLFYEIYKEIKNNQS